MIFFAIPLNDISFLTKYICTMTEINEQNTVANAAPVHFNFGIKIAFIIIFVNAAQ